MFHKKTSEQEDESIFCFCIPSRYVCILFGMAQLAWAVNEFCNISPDITLTSFNVAHGICAALLIYGATKRKHCFMWPSIILITLFCLLGAIGLILIRIAWDEDGLYWMDQIHMLDDDDDSNEYMLTELSRVFFLIVLLTLNYVVYNYAIQLKVDERVKQILIQRGQFVPMV